MNERELRERAILDAYARYLAAFVANDLATLDTLIAYPVTYIADGVTHTLTQFPVAPAELLAAKQWHTTINAEYAVVASSADKAHVVLTNASRVRIDGSLIEQVAAFYAFKRTAEGWKIFAMSDVLTPAGSC